MFLGILFVSVTDGGGCYREEEFSEEKKTCISFADQTKGKFQWCGETLAW